MLTCLTSVQAQKKATLVVKKKSPIHFRLWDCNLKLKFWVANIGHVVMLDWDFKEGSDVMSMQEVETLLTQDTANNPHHLWKLYETPNGAHAFFMSEARCPYTYYDWLKSFKQDHWYLAITLELDSFRVRVTPKAGREGDYVARFRKYVCTGTPDPRIVEVMEQHDMFL